MSEICLGRGRMRGSKVERWEAGTYEYMPDMSNLFNNMKNRNSIHTVLVAKNYFFCPQEQSDCRDRTSSVNVTAQRRWSSYPGPSITETASRPKYTFNRESGESGESGETKGSRNSFEWIANSSWIQSRAAHQRTMWGCVCL